MSEAKFRQITDHELKLAYKLHCEVVDYLISKGIRQWLRPIDYDKLERRQSNNENYGLFSPDDELLVFLSLIERTDYHEWENYMTKEGTIWLNTVSVNLEFKNQGLGKTAIHKAVSYLKEKRIDELYLDCVINDGFLVKYYQDLGFELIAETKASYRTGDFEMALMRKKLSV